MRGDAALQKKSWHGGAGRGPPATLPDDRTLMRGIEARDPGALAGLYDLYAGAIMAVCLRILRDPTEAEEVVIDVFHEIWRRAPRYDASRSPPLVYLLTVARSRALDRRRRLMRRGLLRTSVREADDEPTERVPSDEPSPLASALVSERRIQARRALEALKPRDRVPVELALLDGLTHPEISERLDLPLGTVKTRIRRGLAQLRSRLQGGETT